MWPTMGIDCGARGGSRGSWPNILRVVKWIKEFRPAKTMIKVEMLIEEDMARKVEWKGER
jgi:hypothetical protein